MVRPRFAVVWWLSDVCHLLGSFKPCGPGSSFCKGHIYILVYTLSTVTLKCDRVQIYSECYHHSPCGGDLESIGFQTIFCASLSCASRTRLVGALDYYAGFGLWISSSSSTSLTVPFCINPSHKFYQRVLAMGIELFQWLEFWCSRALSISSRITVKRSHGPLSLSVSLCSK